MSKKLVTILMPCKDPSAMFLQEALQSAFNQSSNLWDLVLIYDHIENQQIPESLKKLNNKNDSRISILKNDSIYVTGALNTGMRYARTPFVCSFHCDDLLNVQTIEILNENIKTHPEVDFFHSARVIIDEKGQEISPVYKARESFDLKDFKRSGPAKLLHCWRVEFALGIGGMDESLGPHGADDYDFVWTMAEEGCVFKAIPECLYYYRDQKTQYRLTTHVPLQKQVDELTKIFKKHGMTDDEIHQEIAKRKAGYLSQALFK